MINQYGGPEQLQVQETGLPTPAKGELLIRVHAAGINPVDYKMRNGSMRLVTGKNFPMVLGGDVAGVVEQAPRGSAFRPGDKVFALLGAARGGYSEFVTIKESHLGHIPQGISMAEAAAVPMAGLTALQSLLKGGSINKGDRILVIGASGGVGHFAVQLAKAMGAHVTGICSTPNVEFVDALGADQVIDYTREDYYRLNKTFVKVFDAAAKSSFGKARKVLDERGIYVTTLPSTSAITRSILSPLTKKKAHIIRVKPSGSDLQVVADYMAKGLVRPQVERIFSFRQAAEAHKLIETQKVRGKIVFSVIPGE